MKAIGKCVMVLVFAVSGHASGGAFDDALAKAQAITNDAMEAAGYR